MDKYNKMKIAGKKVSDIHNKLGAFIVEGISTEILHDYCKNIMLENNLKSGSLNYHGFPKYLCISVNDKVCHGISSDKEILRNGDLVSVDIAASYDNYFGDTCVTYIVGSTKYEKLFYTGYESMWNAIYNIKEGICVTELGRIMEKTATNNGFQTVYDFCGHGIGVNMHESPQVPFYYDPYYKHILKAGDCITIEPMVVEKSNKLRILSDKWTAVTKDNGMSVQFEHTVYVHKNGYEVLTYNEYDLKNNKTKSNN